MLKAEIRSHRSYAGLHEICIANEHPHRHWEARRGHCGRGFPTTRPTMDHLGLALTPPLPLVYTRVVQRASGSVYLQRCGALPQPCWKVSGRWNSTFRRSSKPQGGGIRGKCLLCARDDRTQLLSLMKEHSRACSFGMHTSQTDRQATTTSTLAINSRQPELLEK